MRLQNSKKVSAAGVGLKSNFCYEVGAVTESQIVGKTAGLILSDMGLLLGLYIKQ